MTIPVPDNMGVSWSVFWSVVSGLLGTLGAMLLLLYKNTTRQIKEKYEAADKSVVQLERRVEHMSTALDKQIDAMETTMEERLSTYFKAHERLRDKWDNFLREYLKIDSTRGQKVDALFRVVDQMQSAVEQIPRNMNDKIEESFTHSMSELKLYVRDQIQTVVHDLGQKNDR